MRELFQECDRLLTRSVVIQSTQEEPFLMVRFDQYYNENRVSDL